MIGKPFHVHLHGPDRGPIAAAFEAAAERLQSDALAYFEPDGSFVIARDSGREQVFGMLYDAAGSLQYVDFRGQCRLETWRRTISAIEGEAGGITTVLVLPQGEVQELQSFERLTWPASDRSPTPGD